MKPILVSLIVLVVLFPSVWSAVPTNISIPISYQTDTDVDIDCTYKVFDHLVSVVLFAIAVVVAVVCGPIILCSTGLLLVNIVIYGPLICIIVGVVYFGLNSSTGIILLVFGIVGMVACLCCQIICEPLAGCTVFLLSCWIIPLFILAVVMVATSLDCSVTATTTVRT